jgi:hypothetical protein
VQDGWHYVEDDLEHESFAPLWVQPEGAHNAYAMGDIVRHSGGTWRSLIEKNVWEPGVTGWGQLGSTIPAWVQPLGAHDSYALGGVVAHAGSAWKSTVDANVWEPGVYGWIKVAVDPPAEGVPVPEWVQPTGAHDDYDLGAHVMHNAIEWVSTVAANVWEPGVYGWNQV